MRDAAENPDDPAVLYELGYQLIEQGLHGIAATVLTRALSFAPGEEGLVNELCSALEGSGFSAEACKVLRASPELVEKSFVCRYLLAFNAIMSGDLVTPERLLRGLETLADRSSAGHTFMRSTLAGMILRARAIRDVARLDEIDLRGWHFVLTGGLLAHVSPHGFEEGMRGRYAYVQDSPYFCVEGLRRLQAILQAYRLAPSRLLYLPDRGSEILGRAAAKLLDLPAAPWPAGGDEGPALIVAYDLAHADEDALASVHERRAGQILFVHAACWTQPPPFAPDVVTFLYQVNGPFWGERFGAHSTAEGTVLLPEVARPAEAIALEIAEAVPAEGALDDLPALSALAEKIAERGYDALVAPGRRGRFWPSSPVKSNRFL